MRIKSEADRDERENDRRQTERQIHREMQNRQKGITQNCWMV